MKQKKISHIGMLAILLITATLLLGLNIYVYFQTNDLQNHADESDAAVQTKTVLIQNPAKKTSVIAKENENLKYISSYFIQEGQEYKMVKIIENICGAASVSCTINPTGLIAGQGIPSGFHLLHLVVDAKGGFGDLHHFTSVLENLPYRASISEVGLQSTTESTSSRVWAGHYDLNVTTTP